VIKVFDGIKNLLVGLVTTGKHLPRKHITIQYPDERWKMPERSRGIVVLLSDLKTGELNCTACLLCMRACPTAAIRIDYEKDEKNKRHLKKFVVDQGLCCFCGLCEESCKFAAIKMATKYEFSTLSKGELVWGTEKLQEVGRDVPYIPREKKKPKPKPADKPADKLTESADVKPAEKPADDTSESKPAEPSTPETPTVSEEQTASEIQHPDNKQEGPNNA
jgi:NADH-quinone oxidoreductase chain I